MSFFPLPYRCKLQRGIHTTDRTGQTKFDTFALIATPKCLYLETSGGKVHFAGESYESMVAFYVGPLEDVQEGDLISDIVDKKGNLIDAGPFEILSINRIPGLLSSAVHHKSCKLKGIAG